jgi:hypothetical protein
MGDHDTDVAEYLYKAGATRAGVIKLLCKDLSKACVGKLPRLPKVLQFHFINLIVKCIEIIHILQRFSLQHHMGLFITQHLGCNEQDRVAGESFTPKEGKEAEMEKLMRSLNVSYK